MDVNCRSVDPAEVGFGPASRRGSYCSSRNLMELFRCIQWSECHSGLLLGRRVHFANQLWPRPLHEAAPVRIVCADASVLRREGRGNFSSADCLMRSNTIFAFSFFDALCICAEFPRRRPTRVSSHHVRQASVVSFTKCSLFKKTPLQNLLDL